jgi:carbonic anhydrase/acetyltransferase-like protein (isoleucine patch superfamily)
MLYKLGDKRVVLHGDGHFIAPNASVIGDVTLGPNVSIWFNVVIRADYDRVVIGEGTNIQDGSVLHVDPDCPLVIGRDVTVGHLAIVHSCTVGNGSLIGINAVVLKNAIIGNDCLVGANALVPEGMVVPDGSVVLGSPGRIRKNLGDEERKLLRLAAMNYVANANKFNQELEEDPRT